MMHNTATRTAATFERNIARPRVAVRKPRTEAEPFDPSKVSTTLSTVAAQAVLAEAAHTAKLLGRDLPKAPIVVGVGHSLESLGKGTRWTEVALSDCRYGCKVYENDLTGERALAHSSVYGCTTR